MTTMTDQTPRPLTDVGTKIEPVALDTEDLAVEAIVYEGPGPLHLTMAIGGSEADHRDGRRYRVEWMQTIPATSTAGVDLRHRDRRARPHRRDRPDADAAEHGHARDAHDPRAGRRRGRERGRIVIINEMGAVLGWPVIILFLGIDVTLLLFFAVQRSRTDRARTDRVDALRIDLVTELEKIRDAIERKATS
jgi:hypothetical protein